MKRYEILDRLEELWENANDLHVGSNEAELEYREQVADFIQELVKLAIQTTLDDLNQQ